MVLQIWEMSSNDPLGPMDGSPDVTCLLCKVYKCSKEDLKEEVFQDRRARFRAKRRLKHIRRERL